MSLAVFPFKSEPPSLVARNVAIAARSSAIDEVWAVAAEDGETEMSVRGFADDVASAEAKPVTVMVQDRVGGLRAGKGDAMNTAIAKAAGQGRDRVHFYDADITNFGSRWIDGAESAANRGFGIVRHRFPRAATDAMITWMITKPALARLFPGTMLPRLDQPLGGELLLGRDAIEALAASEQVRHRSDWGIDTMITYTTSILGLGVYEHHIEDGKRHTLYGSLDELRDMLIECLDAAASLAGRPGPDPDAKHGSDPPAPVPDDLKTTVAYDVEGTIHLLATAPVDGEIELAAALPGSIAGALFGPESLDLHEHIDADLWYDVHGFLLDGFVLGDPAWESLAFRLWLTRVLAYTTNQARLGYDRAIAYLESTIGDYEQRSLNSPRSAPPG